MPKLCGAPDFVEFVLGRFSHFYIAYTYIHKHRDSSKSWRLVEFEAEDVERLVALGDEAVHVIPASCPMVVGVAVTGRLVPEVRIELALTHPP